MASLDSPLTKYNRATEHAETLRSKLLPLSDLNNYSISSDFDVKTGEQIRRFEHVLPMPGGLEVIVGEALYNFRCSLDHLIWQLVLSEGNVPTTRNEFPIFSDPTRYEAEKHGKLSGVSNAVRSIVDALQPCNSTGRDDYWKHLWELQVLNNIDKHRHLLLTRRTLAPILRVWGSFGNRTPRGYYLAVPVEDGAVFFRAEPNVNMDVKPGIEVLFSDVPPGIRQDISVLGFMALIHSSVDEVFRQLRSHVK